MLVSHPKNVSLAGAKGSYVLTNDETAGHPRRLSDLARLAGCYALEVVAGIALLFFAPTTVATVSAARLEVPPYRWRRGLERASDNDGRFQRQRCTAQCHCVSLAELICVRFFHSLIVIEGYLFEFLHKSTFHAQTPMRSCFS